MPLRLRSPFSFLTTGRPSAIGPLCSPFSRASLSCNTFMMVQSRCVVSKELSDGY